MFIFGSGSKESIERACRWKTYDAGGIDYILDSGRKEKETKISEMV